MEFKRKEIPIQIQKKEGDEVSFLNEESASKK